MARYRGQKALYEVIGQARLRPVEAESAEPLRPSQPADLTVASPPVAVDPAPEPSTTPGPTVRWQRPRPIQFNAGRIELTIPYPIAVAIVLALVVMLLVAYRWGQGNPPGAGTP